MESSLDIHAAMQIQRALITSLIDRGAPTWRISEEIDYLKQLQVNFKVAEENECYIAEANK